MKAAATLAGIALAAAHAAALPALVRGCHADELEVAVRGPPVAAAPSLDGDVPASLAARVERAVDGAGPGLVRARWRVRHRGGHVREVGAAQLVGPFQSPAAPPCGARLVVGARLLDDGAAGPGTVAATIRAGLDRELAGFEQFPAGRFRRVAAVEARWARFDEPGGADPDLFGDVAASASASLAQMWRTDGYLRVRAAIELDRLDADVVVALVPRVEPDRLRFELYAKASLSYGNRVVDRALELLRLDRHASRVIRDELDRAILSAFDPPPPLELPGGRALRVGYCAGAHVRIDGGAAALPLRLAFDGPGPAGALPPRLGPAAPPPPDPDAALAFDLDLDTVNALLHELWRTGFLDEQLDAAGLDRRFNDDPLVTSLLTLRVSPLRLALPPVVTPAPGGGLRLAADLRAHLADGPAITPARVWAALDLALDPAADPAADVAELDLACEPSPGRLRPCYADLVAAMRGRAGDARDALGATLTAILHDLFAGRRVAAHGAPAALVLGPPRTSAHAAGPTATVRIVVPARLDETP